MDTLYYLGLGSFMPFITLIIFLVLFSKISSLKHRLDALTREIEKLKGGKVNLDANATLQKNVYSELDLQPSETLTPQNILTPNEILFSRQFKVEKPEIEGTTYIEGDNGPLINWLKENPMLKLGVALVLLGVGWFVSYAFIHDWIGPVGRIVLGFLTGAIVTIFGTLRLGKNEDQGTVLTILGTAIITMTSLAGQYYYNFYPQTAALLLIFLVSLYTSLSAIAWSREKLAVYGIILSLLAPVLSYTGNMDTGLLFLYLIIISISTIWISIVKKWNKTLVVGITGVFLYSLPYIALGQEQNSENYYLLSLSYINSLIYLAVGVWSIIANKDNLKKENLFMTILNTVIIIGVTMSFVPTYLQSLFMAFWMVVYAISGYFVFATTKDEKLMYIHSLFAILFLGIATSIELSGSTLVIALAIESAIVSLSAYVVTKSYENACVLSFFMAIPVLLSASSFVSSKWEEGIFHSDMAVLLIISVILATLSYFLKNMRSAKDEDKNIGLESSFLIISTIYAYALIWLSLHYLLLKDMATFASLFIYTVVGLYSHFRGIFDKKITLKNYGTALLVCVLVRLIFIDIWEMGIVLRVITFVVIGIMFIGTAFISKKYKND